MTIPELGTIAATHPPIIVLTSNRTRDLHDAVKRRCLYHWIDYPTPEREVEIVRRRVQGRVARRWRCRWRTRSSRMRDSDVQKPPGIAEAIDWLAALSLLGVEQPGRRGGGPHAGLGAEVRRGPGGDPRGRPRAARAQRWLRRRAGAGFGVETIHLDLPPLAGALSRRLRDAGVPVTPERSAEFARALDARAARSAAGACTGPRARCSSPTRRTPPAFDAVFCSVFGAAGRADEREARRRADRRRAADERPAAEHAVRRASRRPARGRVDSRAPARATRSDEAPRSRSRWRWPATRSGWPARASTRSSRTSSRSSTG